MGIDAMMEVRLKQPISPEQTRQLAYRLADCYGHNKFYIDREGKYGEKTHCIEWDESGFNLKVNIWTRYYGKNYERGDLPFIISVAEWFESAIPNCDVFYGGDHDFQLHPFGKEERQELFEHFVKVGHEPYTLSPNEPHNEMCEFCNHLMTQYGWGMRGNYAAYVCRGCGEKRTYENGELKDRL